MKRHPANPNLTLYYDHFFRGLPILVDMGPCILEYLETLYRVIFQACNQYSRVFAFRFDIRFPADQSIHDFSRENGVMSLFFESFKAKIWHDRQMAFRKNQYAHDTVVRYGWAREVGGINCHTHYHGIILLNYEAYCSIGKLIPGHDNLFNKLNDALASALCLSPKEVIGLIEIPKNAYCLLQLNDIASIEKFFERASYLCKAETKVYGDGHHGFGSSRN